MDDNIHMLGGSVRGQGSAAIQTHPGEHEAQTHHNDNNLGNAVMGPLWWFMDTSRYPTTLVTGALCVCVHARIADCMGQRLRKTRVFRHSAHEEEEEERIQK